MLAVVKMPHTSFTVSGDIPENILSILKTYYKKHLILEDEKNEYVEASTMDWYKEAEKRQTPAKTLRFYRTLNKLTQVQLAEKLGVTKQFISNMETGQKPISRKTAYLLSEIFGIDAGRFI
ncbi:helix-turn-helix transcriptional regulator [Treponema denticola]|uniref:helix-turn-helix domain-containing protein n=1 Tax=Treponema denticola TaxID=158 RepID=UPI003D6DBFF0